jgi:hypothetical protein
MHVKPVMPALPQFRTINNIKPANCEKAETGKKKTNIYNRLTKNEKFYLGRNMFSAM